MLEAAQAHLDFAARTRKEAEEAAARDAKALAEKRALEDAEREAREARRSWMTWRALRRVASKSAEKPTNIDTSSRR